MKTLDIAATTRTPRVLFDFDGNYLKLSGESYPEDVNNFYSPIIEALDNYLSTLVNGQCRFDFELIYFNSSSAKAIMMLMDRLEESASEGSRIDVYWLYDPEDATMEELGEEFGEDLVSANFHLQKMA